MEAGVTLQLTARSSCRDRVQQAFAHGFLHAGGECRE
jgi:hypothetical protein